MKKPEITEGEWQVVHHTDNRIGVQSVEDSYMISSICNMSPFREEILENAQAISAVPKMIDALLTAYEIIWELKNGQAKHLVADIELEEIKQALEKAGVEL